MISGLFDHTEDRSELSGATLSFLPLLSATGLFTRKFHPSFRSMLTVFKTGHLLLFEYWATFTSGFCYTRISPLHYPTAWYGFFWPFGPASIVAARILLVLTGTRTRTYRFVLPFELPAFLSQEKQNLTAAVSRKQPGHKFRYSRKG